MPKGIKLGGRKKGTPNKLTAGVKEMILGALDKAGGVEYLYQQARDNPSALMTLVGKVLPLTLSGDPNAPLNTLPPVIQFVQYKDAHDAPDPAN
jgi:hypothetical protein